jgi:hypothetical protein
MVPAHCPAKSFSQYRLGGGVVSLIQNRDVMRRGYTVRVPFLQFGDGRYRQKNADFPLKKALSTTLPKSWHPYCIISQGEVDPVVS